MKKIIHLAAVSIMFAFTMQSCGNNSSNQNTTKKADSTAVKTVTADSSKTASTAPETAKTMYKCPGCGKVFDKPGKCPECGLTLVQIKS